LRSAAQVKGVDMARFNWLLATAALFTLGAIAALLPLLIAGHGWGG